jgi:transposase-like protein
MTLHLGDGTLAGSGAVGCAGVPVAQILRNHGVSHATYYKWKAKYGGASVAELKRLAG